MRQDHNTVLSLISAQKANALGPSLSLYISPHARRLSKTNLCLARFRHTGISTQNTRPLSSLRTAIPVPDCLSLTFRLTPLIGVTTLLKVEELS